ncbi:MAG: hypothetical protein JKY56_27810, partial [Kofleriaceae bacterium]|nr:hypothetical protein [Kofleriaceae bacterium]
MALSADSRRKILHNEDTMSTAPKTTRDQLNLLVDLVRRTKRHLWLVGLLAVVGGGLATMLAMKQTPKYDSETVLLYQEKISQSVLQGREVARNSRTMSTRFKEMLLSRTSMGIIVKEFDLYPGIVETDGTVAAAEKLRLLVNFTTRGAGTYKISFRGNSAEEAQQITARLASLLLERDERVRRDQAEQTQKFLQNEVVRAENTLFEAEGAFAGFVSRHPEFVTDIAGGGAGGGVGSAIRAKEASDAALSSKRSSSGGSRIGALKRAAKRLRDRIANPSAPIAPIARKIRRTDSPALQEARRELSDAKRDLAAKTARFTPKHPDVKAAQNGVNELTRRLRRVEAEDAKRQPPSTLTAPVITASTSVADLKEELARIDSEISRLKNKSKDSEEPVIAESSIVDDLVKLETEHAKLQRRVSVTSQRLSSLEAKAFTAEITASAEFAEAAQLVIIEKAYLPARPAGKGKKIVVMAGIVVFGLLGGVIALGLALIDDRIYRRADIDEMGIAPVLVVIP